MQRAGDGSLVPSKQPDRGTPERGLREHGLWHPGNDEASKSPRPSSAIVRDPFDQLVIEGIDNAGIVFAEIRAELASMRDASDELRRLAMVAGIMRSARNPLDQGPRGRAVALQPEVTASETAARAYARVGERIGEPYFGMLQDLLVFGREISRERRPLLLEALRRLDKGVPRRVLLR